MLPHEKSYLKLTFRGFTKKVGIRTRKILKELRGRGASGNPHPIRLKKLILATLRSGAGHYRSNLREDDADAVSNTRHNRASRDGHETRHQCILDEVLTTLIFPNLQLQNKIFHFSFVSSPLRGRGRFPA